MAASNMVIEPMDPGIPCASAPGACLIVQPIDRIGPAPLRAPAAESRGGNGRAPAIRAEPDVGERRQDDARTGQPA
ncbi:hypothetical protein [Methylobacterium fujisawaense]|uniref:hypothetical protein n=1 Tax=Methylobacterium fujisawaense TaxID=107400 RepID=UPI00313CEBC7